MVYLTGKILRHVATKSEKKQFKLDLVGNLQEHQIFHQNLALTKKASQHEDITSLTNFQNCMKLLDIE